MGLIFLFIIHLFSSVFFSLFLFLSLFLLLSLSLSFFLFFYSFSLSLSLSFSLSLSLFLSLSLHFIPVSCSSPILFPAISLLHDCCLAFVVIHSLLLPFK